MSTGLELLEGSVSELSSWLKIIKKTQHQEFSMSSFVTLHQVVKCDQARMHINDQKLVMQLEIDVGSELPMASFNVPHPGLAQLSICSNQLCTLMSKRHSE